MSNIEFIYTVQGFGEMLLKFSGTTQVYFQHQSKKFGLKHLLTVICTRPEEGNKL